MKLDQYKLTNLLDVADIERSKKGQVYEKGNIIIQVSATKGQIFYLDEEQEVESKYAVLFPKNIESKYLYYILQQELPNFLKKYQTDINIQIDVFKYLKINLHEDRETQKHMIKMLDNIEEQIKQEEKIVNEAKDFKKYHLNKMFI